MYIDMNTETYLIIATSHQFTGIDVRDRVIGLTAAEQAARNEMADTLAEYDSVSIVRAHDGALLLELTADDVDL